MNEKGDLNRTVCEYRFSVLRALMQRGQEFVERMAGKQRPALTASREASLRSEVARRLSALAVFVRKKETRCVIWKRPESQ